MNHLSKINKSNFLIIFLLFFSIANAQETETENTEEVKSKFWKNMHFGGGIGLNFSSGYSNFSITPTGLYQFNDYFGLGIGLNANYTKSKNDFQATVLGGSIIGILKPIQELQLSVAFEENNVNFKDEIINSTTNYWQPALFLGAGYSVGEFGAIGIRYDLLFDEDKSPYGTALLPFIRVYF